MSSAADYRGKQTAFEGQMPDINPGTVVAVAAGPRHRFSETVQDRILLVQDHGVEGDAHAGAFIPMWWCPTPQAAALIGVQAVRLIFPVLVKRKCVRTGTPSYL